MFAYGSSFFAYFFAVCLDEIKINIYMHLGRLIQ